MCEIDGYAIAEVDLPGRRGERHAWGLSRTSPDELKIFDSNYGEFRVPTAELPAFLSHINEQIRADLGQPIDKVNLRPMIVDPRYEGTPAADLCRWLASTTSSRSDGDQQDATPSASRQSDSHAAPSTLTHRRRMPRPDGA
jgi:hypothetical protein